MITKSNSGQQEHQPPTAVWRNGGFSASYDSFVVGSSAVLRLNICDENPPLRQAAKRYKQAKENLNGNRTIFREFKKNSIVKK